MGQIKVVNQFGKYIDGKERDEIINAAYADRTSVIIDEVYVAIVAFRKDEDGNEVVEVQVDV